MKNKEQKYRSELFELLKNDIGIEDETSLNLIREVFLTNSEDINPEDILNKLIEDEE